MADNSILTPGYQDPIETPVTSPPQEDCLIKDNFLSEYETEEEKNARVKAEEEELNEITEPSEQPPEEATSNETAPSEA